MKTKKTLSEQIQSFAEQVESMSNFKNEPSKKGQEIYKDYQDKLPSVIDDLRNKGVSEETHPKFANAMIMYNAWKLTTHDRTIQLITALDYNARQVAQVLGISTKGAEKKIKQEGSNKFLEKDFVKFTEFINNLKKKAK